MSSSFGHERNQCAFRRRPSDQTDDILYGGDFPVVRGEDHAADVVHPQFDQTFGFPGLLDFVKLDNHPFHDPPSTDGMLHRL